MGPQQYLVRATVCAVCFLPAILIFRIFRRKYLRKRGFCVTIRHETGEILFFCCLSAIISLTVLCDLPAFSFSDLWINLLPGKVLFTTKAALAGGNSGPLWINFLGNILIFLPIGFFPPLIWNLSGKKTVGICFLISLFIELAQLFLPRTSDIDDLILNTLGGAIGVMGYQLFSKIGNPAEWKIKKHNFL